MITRRIFGLATATALAAVSVPATVIANSKVIDSEPVYPFWDLTKEVRRNNVVLVSVDNLYTQALTRKTNTNPDAASQFCSTSRIIYEDFIAIRKEFRSTNTKVILVYTELDKYSSMRYDGPTYYRGGMRIMYETDEAVYVHNGLMKFIKTRTDKYNKTFRIDSRSFIDYGINVL